MPGPRETSGVTTRLVLRYVRARGGDAAVSRVLALAGLPYPVDVLEDESSWVSYDDKIALFTAAATELDDPDVSRAIGATVLDARVGLGVRVLLRALGSPRRVLENIARTAPKFSAVCVMSTYGVAGDQATVSYRLADGYAPHPLDCAYNMGLLSQVPRLFGLPAAKVSHDVCQVDGADRCVYLVTWRRRRLGARRRERDVTADQVRSLQEQIAAIEASVSGVATGDVPAALRGLAARAAGAVGARAYVLGLSTPAGLVVWSEGIGAFRAERLARRLVEQGEEPDASLLVARIGDRGVLVAVPGDGQEFFPGERDLLDAYAAYAVSLLGPVSRMAAVASGVQDGGSPGGGGADSSAIGDDDNAASRRAGRRAVGRRSGRQA